MTYPFVSIMPLIDEIRNELKVIVKTSSFSDEDMYGWAVQAARLIKNCLYEPDKILLTVNKYTAVLPREFYLLNNLFLCEISTLTYTTAPLPAGSEPFRWIRSRVLRPGDSTTRAYCTDKCIKGNTKDLSYTFKIPPGIARFSFHTGKVEMDYERMKMCEDGSIMIQDEPNTWQATKAFIKLMLVQEKFILQECPQYVYREIKDEWDKYTQLAQLALKFPSNADTNYLALKQDARFRNFRYKDQ